jgi:hypothetical protein
MVSDLLHCQRWRWTVVIDSRDIRMLYSSARREDCEGAARWSATCSIASDGDRQSGSTVVISECSSPALGVRIVRGLLDRQRPAPFPAMEIDSRDRQS